MDFSQQKIKYELKTTTSLPLSLKIAYVWIKIYLGDFFNLKSKSWIPIIQLQIYKKLKLYSKLPKKTTSFDVPTLYSEK